MASPISRSGQHQNLQVVHAYYGDTRSAIQSFYQNAHHNPARFASYSSPEISQELSERLEELDRTCCLSIVTCIEAAFQLDFDRRVQARKKDPLSVACKHIHTNVTRKPGARISLEKHILKAWRSDGNLSHKFLHDLGQVLLYRHWLAHGRYWNPKLFQIYDYQTVYLLADSLFKQVPTLPNP